MIFGIFFFPLLTKIMFDYCPLTYICSKLKSYKWIYRFFLFNNKIEENGLCESYEVPVVI